MANKEALRDLQTRLAERMQQARARTDTVQSWLAVECRGLGLLLPLEQAGEIHAHVTPTAVPHTQAWFRGVANLRGGLFAVVDLGAYLGVAAPKVAALTRDQARLVAVNPQFGVNCALSVDRLAGLKRADQMKLEADEPGVQRPPFAGGRWSDQDARVWQEIRVSELVADEQFLGVAA
jgi:twitching motility protein PilI